MDIYMRCVRPQFPPPRDNNIFLQGDGKCFAHDVMGKRLPNFGARSGVQSDLRVTATNVRKWIVTTCHQKKEEGLPVAEDALRRAMCHSNRVAKSNYLQEDLTRVASEATNTIALCTRGATDDPKSKLPRLDEQPEDQSAELYHQRQDQSAEGAATPPRNRPLTDTEKSTIQEAFADQLRKDQKILLVDVRQVMEGHPTLAALEPFAVMSKRVADYLRYLQTTSVSNVPDQPHERVAKWVSTTASTATTATCGMLYIYST